MKLKEIKTISKFSLFLLSITVLSGLSVLSMVGCKKTESAVNSDNEIKFSVGGMPNTKTAFSRTNSYQLIWIDGDQISIFCDQAKGDNNKQKAAYNVKPKEQDSTRGTLSIADADSTGLRWGDAAIPHNLYAVYPSIAKSGGNVIKETAEGVFTFNFPKIQECSVIDGYDVGNKKMLKPNMYLAYMVAKQEELTQTKKEVNLSFKPIATTLEITLQGAAQGDVVISGIDVNVNVKSLNENLVKESDTKDSYQIQFTAKDKDFYSDVSNALTAYSSGGVTNATFNIRLSDGNYTLESGKSVTFTVFLPPIKSLDDVKVECLDANDNVLGTKQLFINSKYASPASKSFFTLPQIKIFEVTPETASITYPNTVQLTAKFKGTVVTSSCTWTSANTNKIIVNGRGVVSGGFGMPGDVIVTASYTVNGVAYTDNATITIGVYRTFVRSDYMTWDAAMASTNNRPAYSKAQMDAHLAKSGIVSFWDDNGPAYTFSGSEFGTSNGTVHTAGRWILKYSKTAGTANNLAEARTNDDYIFLPACGYFPDGVSFSRGGAGGIYWLSTPNPSNTNTACTLYFTSSATADVSPDCYRTHGHVPMPSL